MEAKHVFLLKNIKTTCYLFTAQKQLLFITGCVQIIVLSRVIGCY